MRVFNWSRIFYLIAVLLAVAGAIIKITGSKGWEIAFIAAAAAMLVHLAIDQLQKKQ